MRKVLLFLLVPFFAYSQNCDLLLKKKTDELTNAVTLSSKTEMVIVNKEKTKGFTSMFSGDTQSFMWFFEVIGGGDCIDKQARISFFFDNGDQVNYLSSDKFNCEKQASILFMLPQDTTDLIRLSSESLKGMKIETYKSVVSLIFTDQQKKIVKGNFKCAIDKLKTL
jgi:hypothetical protein